MSGWVNKPGKISCVCVCVCVCVCLCVCVCVCKKYYIWNLATSSCENGKYVGSIIGDPVITCDEIC